MSRIASLLPSATEMVCALGLQDQLVGISHECDFPPEVRGLPVLTAARLQASATSRNIDRDVRDLVRDALSVYEIDVGPPGEPAPTLSETELEDLDPAPEVVLIKPCGYSIDRTLSEEQTLRSMFDHLDWPAVRNGQIYIADGNAFFMEILAACVHPEVFGSLAHKHREHCIRWPEHGNAGQG